MSNCIIKGFCSACNGNSVIDVWNGEVDEGGNFVGPIDADCPHCVGGLVQTSTVDIPILDDILDKINDLEDKINDVKEVVDEIKRSCK